MDQRLAPEEVSNTNCIEGKLDNMDYYFYHFIIIIAFIMLSMVTII